MKHSDRKAKLLALRAAVDGNSNALRQYRSQQQEDTWFMVVCDKGEPEPEDLVDVRLTGEKLLQTIPYSEFLKAPATYSRFCIQADKIL